MSVKEYIYCVICNKKKQNERRRLWCYKKQIRDKACWDAFEPTQTHSCWQDDERISSLVILSLLFCVWSRARGVKQIMGPFACHHRHHHNGFIVVEHLCVNKRFEEAWNVIFKGGGGSAIKVKPGVFWFVNFGSCSMHFFKEIIMFTVFLSKPNLNQNLFWLEPNTLLQVPTQWSNVRPNVVICHLRRAKLIDSCPQVTLLYDIGDISLLVPPPRAL